MNKPSNSKDFVTVSYFKLKNICALLFKTLLSLSIFPNRFIRYFSGVHGD